MPGWAVWVMVGVLGWIILVVLSLRVLGLGRAYDESSAREAHKLIRTAQPAQPVEPVVVPERRRILVVDDDAGLRLLLRTTLTADEFAVEEAVSAEEAADAEQLLIYARALSRLLEIERAQRRLLQQAYSQTATALADALEAKDPVTGLHALRVHRYAIELTRALDPSLLNDPSLEYGFLLHDVGKLGIPDTILLKEGPLTESERQVMQRHTLLGAQILSGVALLHGEGLKVVRSHHERWDGTGYPYGLSGREIPLG